VVHLLRPGDVDGDIQLLLGMPLPYTGQAIADAQYLFLPSAGSDARSTSSTPAGWPAARTSTTRREEDKACQLMKLSAQAA